MRKQLLSAVTTVRAHAIEMGFAIPCNLTGSQ